MRGADFTVPLDEYAERRAKVLGALEGATAVVLAGERPASDLPCGRRPVDAFFWYLTGIDTEPGAAVLFDPSAEDPERRIVLLLRSRDPEVERWDGARASLDSAYKERTGFSSLARTATLPDVTGVAVEPQQGQRSCHRRRREENDVSTTIVDSYGCRL